MIALQVLELLTSVTIQLAPVRNGLRPLDFSSACLYDHLVFPPYINYSRVNAEVPLFALIR